MWLRWWSLGVWALAAASVAYWGLRLFAAAAPVPAHARVADATPPPRGDLSRLLGVDAPPPTAAVAEVPADTRFQLIGVVSPRSPAAAREGVALIAVDGKPPRAFRVGHVVDGTQVLKSVNARGAMLGPRDGNAQVSLNLAPLAPAATGTLPPAGDGAGAPLPPPVPPTVGGGAGMRTPPQFHPGSRRSSAPPQVQVQPQESPEGAVQQPPVPTTSSHSENLTR